MEQNTALQKVKDITAIAVLISTVLGITVTVHSLYGTLNAAKGTLSAVKIQALQQVTGFLDENADVRQEVRGYLKNQLGKNAALLSSINWNKQTGEDLYYSADFEQYKRISTYYERLGSIIDLGYLDFDIIFQVIAFPDRFWQDTRDFRQLLRQNWNGAGRPLDDFQSGFTALCSRYLALRREKGFASANDMTCDTSDNAQR